MHQSQTLLRACWGFKKKKQVDWLSFRAFKPLLLFIRLFKHGSTKLLSIINKLLVLAVKKKINPASSSFLHKGCVHSLTGVLTFSSSTRWVSTSSSLCCTSNRVWQENLCKRCTFYLIGFVNLHAGTVSLSFVYSFVWLLCIGAKSLFLQLFLWEQHASTFSMPHRYPIWISAEILLIAHLAFPWPEASSPPKSLLQITNTAGFRIKSSPLRRG